MKVSQERVYGIWEHMIQRCSNPRDRNYKNYGGRGIRVCDEWKSSKAFIDWANRSGYSDSLSIDRINVNGDYSPDNCRWADLYTQRNNTTRNHRICVDGKYLTLREAADKYGVNYWTLKTRISRGMQPERAIAAPKEDK